VTKTAGNSLPAQFIARGEARCGEIGAPKALRCNTAAVVSRAELIPRKIFAENCANNACRDPAGILKRLPGMFGGAKKRLGQALNGAAVWPFALANWPPSHHAKVMV
jgi:hypothetical protein